MATDFWASSHHKRWIVDRATLKQARADDVQYVDDPEYLDFLSIYFADLITKLGKRLSLRQRVIATATVFFKRFYLKNSFCETDPFIVIAACCYVAAKAEESPVHIKNVVSEARSLFNDIYGIKTFSSDNSKLAEMEFYLVDDLECDLTVFHPYRSLLTLCRKEGDHDEEAEAGERWAATTEGGGFTNSMVRLILTFNGWPIHSLPSRFIINDTYRSDICLLYPPHVIAIAAIYLTFILDKNARATITPLLQSSESSSPDLPQPRRSSRQASHADASKKVQDPIDFLAGLNVSFPLVATIAQDIIALYTRWERYKEDDRPSPFGSLNAGMKRSLSHSNAGTPREASVGADAIVTPGFLSGLLLKMREARWTDIAHPGSGRPVAVNKMLERTQAVG
ncbi:RNA polymerase II holoenzyme cyclin-like subunit [Pleurotus pulmonarius]|nr:RNA polymerase II holoenzyme cyclin-like subunit [Pleurotus pulmonarius]